MTDHQMPPEMVQALQGFMVALDADTARVRDAIADWSDDQRDAAHVVVVDIARSLFDPLGAISPEVAVTADYRDSLLMAGGMLLGWTCLLRGEPVTQTEAIATITRVVELCENDRSGW